MAHRTKHGNATKYGGIAPMLETLPIDELPAGEPAPADHESRVASTEAGRFEPGNRRSVLGGRAHRDQPRLVERIALDPPPEGAPTVRYHRAAKALANATRRSLAATVGGGQLGPLPSYYVGAGARAAKWANYFSDLAERSEAGTKEQRELVSASLAADEKASSHFRNAHEYAAKEAASRPKPLPAWARLGLPPEGGDEK